MVCSSSQCCSRYARRTKAAIAGLNQERSTFLTQTCFRSSLLCLWSVCSFSLVVSGDDTVLQKHTRVKMFLQEKFHFCMVHIVIFLHRGSHCYSPVAGTFENTSIFSFSCSNVVTIIKTMGPRNDFQHLEHDGKQILIGLDISVKNRLSSSYISPFPPTEMMTSSSRT